MARPSAWQVKILFSKDPFDATIVDADFTDVSVYVKSISNAKRGRQRNLDRIEAGTLQLRLRSKGREFDTTNAASPYYPNVVPRRIITVGVASVGTLFYGFIDTIQPVEEGGDLFVDIRAVDAFFYFARTSATFSSGREQSNGRIQRILNAINWPTANRFISNGQSQVEGGTWTEVNALQSLQDVATTENGLLFMSTAGAVRFQDRYHRLLYATAITSQATFGDADVPGELTFKSIKIADDDTLLANHVVVTLGGTQVGVANDTASQTRYLRSDITRDLPLLTTASEGQSAAEWILYQRANLFYRIDSITLDADAPGAVFTQMITREISDRITIKLYPYHNPALTPFVQECFIESVSWSIDRTNPLCTWTLSPADANNYMIADSATQGLADINVAAY